VRVSNTSKQDVSLRYGLTSLVDFRQDYEKSALKDWNTYVLDFGGRCKSVVDAADTRLAAIRRSASQRETEICSQYDRSAPPSDLTIRPITLGEAAKLPAFTEHWWKFALAALVLSWMMINFTFAVMAGLASIAGQLWWLQIAKSEFNIDPDRVYLMGHSMGGAGAIFLGQKHAEQWAALAAIAPAAFMMQSTQKDVLAPIKAAGVPLMITQGDQDPVVPAASVRTWAAAMAELGMEHEYIEMPGRDHGNIIWDGMPDIFRFFAEHRRPPRPAPAFPGRPPA